MQVFYSENIVNDTVVLTDGEHQHLSKVLRKKVGDVVTVCNGKGLLSQAEIVNITKRESVLQLTELVEHTERNGNLLCLAVAPTKSIDRFEWMIEKAVEIGVNTIIPFYSQNSERRRIKMDRLKAISIAAMKQSKTLFLPEIKNPMKFEELVSNDNGTKQKFIAYLRGKNESIQDSFSQVVEDKLVLALIGPEGGFTQEEAKLSVQNGFKAISLGPKRLRTETAAIYTAAAYQLFCK